jgi:transcriptional regulator with XRE-family HTH domain
MYELKIIGEKIKGIREAKGITRQELSFLSSTHYTHLMNIENGKVNPQLKTILKILDALEIKLENLLE